MADPSSYCLPRSAHGSIHSSLLVSTRRRTSTAINPHGSSPSIIINPRPATLISRSNSPVPRCKMLHHPSEVQVPSSKTLPLVITSSRHLDKVHHHPSRSITIYNHDGSLLPPIPFDPGGSSTILHQHHFIIPDLITRRPDAPLDLVFRLGTCSNLSVGLLLAQRVADRVLPLVSRWQSKSRHLAAAHGTRSGQAKFDAQLAERHEESSPCWRIH